MKLRRIIDFQLKGVFGKDRKWLAKQLGITEQTLSRRMKRGEDFKEGELMMIFKILKFSPEQIAEGMMET